MNMVVVFLNSSNWAKRLRDAQKNPKNSKK